MNKRNSITDYFIVYVIVFSRVNAITCPGFPGYCSESFVGQTCVVVCSAGRPNVPLCQVSWIYITLVKHLIYANEEKLKENLRINKIGMLFKLEIIR